MREVFSLFWKEFSKSHILGKSERVPYIRHDFDCNKWEAVVRILVKGYAESQYFPHKISKAFLAGCLFGKGSIICECCKIPSSIMFLHLKLVLQKAAWQTVSHVTMMRCLTFCQPMTVREKSHTAIK